MKKSIEERVKSKLLHIGRKNGVLRILIVPALFFCMSFFHCCRYCRGNGKRFVMLALTLVIFPVYSSFSFPIFITGETQEHSLYVDGAENVALAPEKELSIEDVKLLEDEDVLELDDESDYSGTSHGYAMVDKYEASEILESIGDINEKKGDVKGTEADTQNTDETTHSFSADDWRLILINQQNSIPDDYAVTLGTIKGNLQCDERIIEALSGMLQAAKKDGIGLIVCSPYRDMKRQEYLFNRKINLYMNRGFSYMEAYRLASEYVMVPGASEHQLGLALDIVCGEYSNLDEGFADTAAGKWLAEHSCEYGFILRYPLGKEYITGVEYEPWHFRYVGVEAATVIMEEEITLEEFWEEYVN